MVYTERGILKRSVSIMMTNFLKWKHDYRVWFVFLMEGFLVGQSMSGLIRYALFMKKTVTPFLLHCKWAVKGDGLFWRDCVVLQCTIL